MKNCDKLNYTEKIKWRVRLLWILVAAMIIYMFIVGETGGDSRIMTDLADATSCFRCNISSYHCFENYIIFSI